MLSENNSDTEIHYNNNQNPKKRILIKFGGNAMISPDIRANVISNICSLKDSGFQPVIVHGGGPEISKIFKLAKIESEFIGGHRKTDSQAMTFVEMALKGQVNGELVRLIISEGKPAVGISGKDGKTVAASRRYHEEIDSGEKKQIDLGFVGDVSRINPDLVELLLESGYIPVIAPISIGEDSQNYNINADMFAGHMAAALNAGHFVALTDVDGLLENIENPDSLIKTIKTQEAKKLFGTSIAGGMIPKVEACIIAVEGGVAKSHIVNGMIPDQISDIFLQNKTTGTIITN